MGRRPLWNKMNWSEDETVLFSIRIPKTILALFKAIAKKENSTVSYLFRRQIRTIFRQKTREYGQDFMQKYFDPGGRKPKHKKRKKY
jgi:hypothetical protein